ncbi:sensor histidine kinase [Nocardioides bruguierae]|uniref:histidine kinase n=1 Tax=Nocardioides bruguierae TaxID=2945102 RepID=A0A9X2D8Y1_9ACTN|nr:histidine kinase [Nocardioides bruguierae]MCM0621540.1 histidine kinase [Nocardioides bruguierae]
MTASEDFLLLGTVLTTVSAVTWGLVPSVALRSPWLAGVLASAPLMLVWIGGTRLPLTLPVALVAAASVTWGRSRRAAGVLAFIAWGLVALVVVTGRGGIIVFGTIQVDFNRLDTGDLLTLPFYALGFAAPLLVAELGRRASTTAARAAALEARAGEVEREAAVLDERARLARDLHDVVAHHVSLIAVRAETAPYSEPGLGDAGRRVLSGVADDARRALDELRQVLGVIGRSASEPALSPQPTALDAHALVERARIAGENVTWEPHAPSAGALAAVEPATGLVVYRLLQEGLTNARRHAPGRPVVVRLALGGGRVVLSVSTDVGAATSPPTPGRGLTGARERVEALGGTFGLRTHGAVLSLEADMPGGPA